MQTTPAPYEIRAALDRARSATASACKVRERHRGHRKPNRVRDLTAALERLTDAAAPVRRLSGMVLPHGLPPDAGRDLREASAGIDVERRKLRKMLR